MLKTVFLDPIEIVTCHVAGIRTWAWEGSGRLGALLVGVTEMAVRLK